jgi:class 3 adenylate cyclase
MTATRRLAAILAADVAGYSHLMGGGRGRYTPSAEDVRAELIDPTIAAHRGRLVKTTGDGLLVEFGSVVDALRCATEVQAGMAQGDDRRNQTRPLHRAGPRLTLARSDLPIRRAARCPRARLWCAPK